MQPWDNSRTDCCDAVSQPVLSCYAKVSKVVLGFPFMTSAQKVKKCTPKLWTNSALAWWIKEGGCQSVWMSYMKAPSASCCRGTSAFDANMPGKVFTLGFLYSGEATAALPMPSPSPTAAPESRWVSRGGGKRCHSPIFLTDRLRYLQIGIDFLCWDENFMRGLLNRKLKMCLLYQMNNMFNLNTHEKSSD